METQKPMKDAEFASNEVNQVRKDVWNSFPIVVSYGCTISEVKDIYIEKQAIVSTRPCVSCLVTTNDVCNMRERDK